MPVTVLAIGDQHIQNSNMLEVDIFIEKIIELASQKKPDIICCLGDMLHTHEKLNAICLNKAYELVNALRIISKTYILVGNHDMYNNSQYLNDNHWLNGMKEWNNVVIVDKPIAETINEEMIVFTPYVYNGRFIEALNTLEEDWKDASCIFAHQEFAGCKMGAIISVEGDKWPLDYPHIISGHIHSHQIPQPNIYYPGAAMQHAFGESEKNIIPYITICNEKYQTEEMNLNMPRKKIVYLDVEDLDDYNLPVTEDKIKITVSGNLDRFKALKKTQNYKKLIENGAKINFKPKKLSIMIKDENSQIQENIKGKDFGVILDSIITRQKDPYLMQVYELVVNEKNTQVEDVIFL